MWERGWCGACAAGADGLGPAPEGGRDREREGRCWRRRLRSEPAGRPTCSRQGHHTAQRRACVSWAEARGGAAPAGRNNSRDKLCGSRKGVLSVVAWGLPTAASVRCIAVTSVTGHGTSTSVCVRQARSCYAHHACSPRPAATARTVACKSSARDGWRFRWTGARRRLILFPWRPASAPVVAITRSVGQRAENYVEFLGRRVVAAPERRALKDPHRGVGHREDDERRENTCNAQAGGRPRGGAVRVRWVLLCGDRTHTLHRRALW